MSRLFTDCLLHFKQVLLKNAILNYIEPKNSIGTLDCFFFFFSYLTGYYGEFCNTAPLFPIGNSTSLNLFLFFCTEYLPLFHRSGHWTPGLSGSVIIQWEISYRFYSAAPNPVCDPVNVSSYVRMCVCKPKAWEHKRKIWTAVYLGQFIMGF